MEVGVGRFPQEETYKLIFFLRISRNWANTIRGEEHDASNPLAISNSISYPSTNSVKSISWIYLCSFTITLSALGQANTIFLSGPLQRPKWSHCIYVCPLQSNPSFTSQLVWPREGSMAYFEQIFVLYQFSMENKCLWYASEF